MNDAKEPDTGPASAAPNTSENIEVPSNSPPGSWEMPTPVFKQSTGYLPQGFQAKFPAESQGMAPAKEVPAPVAAVPPPPAVDISESPDIQPQPNLSEDFTVGETALPPPSPIKKKSSGGQAIYVVLGISAMAVIGLGFLILVYYLFFYHPGDSQILN
ncbi:MAG: hypothetical protein ABI999_06305 [Acidobacteriota bacterium]